MLTNEAKTALVIAAVANTPKVPGSDFTEDVLDTLREMHAMCNPDKSPAFELLSAMDKCVGKQEKHGVVPCAILDVRMEPSSTRGVITFLSKKDRDDPGTIEEIRTDRTDTPGGRRMAYKAGSLTGHQVLLYKAQKPIASKPGQTAREVVHIVDQGLSTDPRAAQAKAARDARLAAAQPQG